MGISVGGLGKHEVFNLVVKNTKLLLDVYGTLIHKIRQI